MRPITKYLFNGDNVRVTLPFRHLYFCPFGKKDIRGFIAIHFSWYQSSTKLVKRFLSKKSFLEIFFKFFLFDA